MSNSVSKKSLQQSNGLVYHCHKLAKKHRAIGKPRHDPNTHIPLLDKNPSLEDNVQLASLREDARSNNNSAIKGSNYHSPLDILSLMATM
jgi:hypothetical protein